MADMGSQALTTANTNIKVSFELEKALLELMRALVNLIPDPTVADTMRSEMEKGHVKAEMLDEKDRPEIKKLLSNQGLKEGKDYMFATYRRQDGEPFLTLFYNIKDEEKVLGETAKIDPCGRINKQNSDFFHAASEAGIGMDKTVDAEKMEKFFQSCGVNFDMSKPLSKEDRAYAESLIDSRFNFMSEEQKNSIAQKLSQSGAIEKLYAARAAGIVRNQVLLKHSMDNLGHASVKNIHDLSETEVLACSKRAEMYGLKIAVNGPNNEKYTMSFAQKDEYIMQRVYMDTKYDLYGQAGDLYKKQLEFEAGYYKQVMSSVLNKECPDGSKIPDGCMLVGTKPEPIIGKDKKPVLDANGYQVMARQTLDISRNRAKMNADLGNPKAAQSFNMSNKDFKEKLEHNFGNSQPVLLNPEQAKAYKSASSEKERMRVIQQAKENPEHGFMQKPVFSKDDLNIIEQHEKLRRTACAGVEQPQSADGKTLSPLSTSPLSMYVKEHILNSTQNHDAKDFMNQENSFLNRHDGVILDTCDLTKEEQAYINEASEKMEDTYDTIDSLEDGTNSFEIYCKEDELFNGEFDEQPLQIALDEQNLAASNYFEDVQSNSMD